MNHVFSPHLIIHLRDIIKERKVLILHFDKVAHDLIQPCFWSDNLPDLLEGLLKMLGVFQLLLLGRLLGLVARVVVELGGEHAVVALKGDINR